MKKQFTPILILAFLAFSSCDSESRVESDSIISKAILKETELGLDNVIFEKSRITNASIDEQEKYKKLYLISALKALRALNLSDSEIVENAIKVPEKENTVLLNELLTISEISDINLKNEIQTINNAFKGLEERDYDIAFYVPFGESLNNIDPQKKAIYIIDVDDSPTQNVFQGFTMSDDGKISLYKEPISEEMAEKMASLGQAVVVIGLEDVTPPPILTENIEYNSTSSINKNLWISDLVVKEHKERWIQGASEIAMKMYKYEDNKLTKINLISGYTANGRSHLMIANKVSRRTIRRKNNASISSPLVASNINPQSNAKYYYIVYEADKWPTKTRTAHFNLPDGKKIGINFTSADSEYYNSNTHNNIISSLIDNGGIKFRTSVR
ncbi:MAG: hypothetical protein Q4G16_10500 [Cruoricaptor ignavus]|nr:hypothetical protein [Cruoricaptor ignavus]